MKILIDTERKEVTIMESVKLGDLVNLLHGLFQEEADNYTIKYESKYTETPFQPYYPLPYYPQVPYYQSTSVGTAELNSDCKIPDSNLPKEFISPSLPIGNVYSNSEMRDYWNPGN